MKLAWLKKMRSLPRAVYYGTLLELRKYDALGTSVDKKLGQKPQDLVALYYGMHLSIAQSDLPKACQLFRSLIVEGDVGSASQVRYVYRIVNTMLKQRRYGEAYRCAQDLLSASRAEEARMLLISSICISLHRLGKSEELPPFLDQLDREFPNSAWAADFVSTYRKMKS